MAITATYPDWSILENLPLGEVESLFNEKLEGETYPTIITYDALNRPLATANVGGVQHMEYNDAGFLEKVEAEVAGHDGRDTIIKNIDYDARGQRTRVQYGSGITSENENGVTTKYEYDEETFRLVRLLSTRNNGTDILQDISYNYDPIGNITLIYDQSQAVIFHNGEEVKPENIYSYDALYQLIEAKGRESRKIGGKPPTNKETIPVPHSINPSDKEVRNYRQYYRYDAAGNISSMQHVANVASWTRKYDYSRPETGEEKNNWLHATSLGSNGIYPDKYNYDIHGNMTKMPHLNSAAWDYKDQLIYVNIDPECAEDQEEEKEPQKRQVFYTYDSRRQRVRKVYHVGGQIKERIYLGSYEIYRVNGQKKLDIFHVMDDTQQVCMVETTDEGQRYFRYQLSNHLGSASIELDENATTITYEEYHPFGTTSYRAKNKDMVGAPQKRYRYTGMERDEETGFNYHTARYYLPWLGRWVNCDPLFSIDGLNIFYYSRNNPVKLNDTLGYFSTPVESFKERDAGLKKTETKLESSKNHRDSSMTTQVKESRREGTNENWYRLILGFSGVLLGSIIGAAIGFIIGGGLTLEIGGAKIGSIIGLHIGAIGLGWGLAAEGGKSGIIMDEHDEAKRKQKETGKKKEEEILRELEEKTKPERIIERELQDRRARMRRKFKNKDKKFEPEISQNQTNDINAKDRLENLNKSPNYPLTDYQKFKQLQLIDELQIQMFSTVAPEIFVRWYIKYDWASFMLKNLPEEEGPNMGPMTSARSINN